MICPKCKTDNPETARFCYICAYPLREEKQGSVTISMAGGLVAGAVIAGKYKIFEELGRGGMGVVYKAEDIKLKREVALKFLSEELTLNKDAKARFIQEAQAAAALDHVNICAVYEINEEQGQTFIVMPYLKGQSLKKKLKQGTFNVSEVLYIGKQICEGLGEAHEKGVIHRDIKPANIMLTDKNQVKIMDFGLAKLSWGNDLTKTAAILGTVAYMSPEQIKGEEVDHRTDIWSFGTVLYEILTGKCPFEGEHQQTFFYSVLNKNPISLIKHRKDIPEKLDKIIKKCLEKDPKNRYADTKAVLTDLNSVFDKSISESITKPSIAVLPFVNMSADPENEYFSDGLAEDLINALTKILDLHVMARTSSFAFKGEKKNIREIGQELNVDNLLEGSVRKVGDRVRITAQLVKVENGYHLWSEQYDRKLEDVFAIQDEITERIMDKLKVTFDLKETRSQVMSSIKMEAYDLYLKGRYYLNKLSIDKAVGYYKQAIEKDPDYALAYSAVAEAFTMLSTGFDILPSKDAMPTARENAKKALKLDPNLAEAYVSLGLIALSYDWDREAAKKYFQKAIELNPNSLSAHQWIEFYWSYMEANFDESFVHLKKAQELDPLNLMIKIRLGFISLLRRDYDRAIEQFKAIVDFEPNFALGYNCLTAAYGCKGMYDEAIKCGEKTLEIGPPLVGYISLMAWAYGLAGKKDKANELNTELIERSKKGYVSSFWVASGYLGLGDFDMVFEWLEKAFEERDSNLIYVTVPPSMDPLRSDPRYKQLLAKMGLDNLIPICTK